MVSNGKPSRLASLTRPRQGAPAFLTALASVTPPPPSAQYSDKNHNDHIISDIRSTTSLYKQQSEGKQCSGAMACRVTDDVYPYKTSLPYPQIENYVFCKQVMRG